jgi:hypothetical protein
MYGAFLLIIPSLCCLTRGASFIRQASLSLSLVFRSLLTRGAEIRRQASLSLSLTVVFRFLLSGGSGIRR